MDDLLGMEVSDDPGQADGPAEDAPLPSRLTRGQDRFHVPPPHEVLDQVIRAGVGEGCMEGGTQLVPAHAHQHAALLAIHGGPLGTLARVLRRQVLLEKELLPVRVRDPVRGGEGSPAEILLDPKPARALNLLAPGEHPVIVHADSFLHFSSPRSAPNGPW